LHLAFTTHVRRPRRQTLALFIPAVLPASSNRPSADAT